MHNVLCLYDSSQTFTNTVFEHLDSFAKYSEHRWFYCSHAGDDEFNVDLSRFDAVVIHYSIRLPFDQLSPAAARTLSEFTGLKALFIQDEYDYTYRTWHWIKTLGIQLVFTVVPEANIERIYPSHEFPGTRFLSNLTGYVPDGLISNSVVNPPSSRRLMVGYRGRPLPIRYGRLGMEKVEVGRIVKDYCDAHGIVSDIAWTEESRIYGPGWYDFMLSCRSMLGSESGSNVFDWDGTLSSRIEKYRELNPRTTDDEIYKEVVQSAEIDGLMNQVSPRIFEAIAARTALVLFEGNYSGAVVAGKHFISLKKDGGNLSEVVCLLQDGPYLDAMVERAYHDVILSGKYSYRTFVQMVDREIEYSLEALVQQGCIESLRIATRSFVRAGGRITSKPLHAPSRTLKEWAWHHASNIWMKLPEGQRQALKPSLKRLLGKK